MLQIRAAKRGDLKRILEIYRIARDFMISYGNDIQWGHKYPEEDTIKADVRLGQSFVVCEGDIIHGVFVLFKEEEPTYRVIDDGAWPNDEPYITIHRVASDGEKNGIFSCIMEYCKARSANIRIDTHEKNIPMQKAIMKEGFQRCGIIYVRDHSPRIAYQWQSGRQ